MRAAVLTDYSQPFTIEELEPEPLRPRDVLLRLDASGVCHSDLTIATGGMPLPLPVLLGHEGCGTVLEVGSEVTRVQPGDRVIAGAAQCGLCANCLQGYRRSCLLAGEAASSPKGRRADGTPIGGLGGMGLFTDVVPIHEIQLLKVDSPLPSEQLALVGCGVATGLGAAVYAAKVVPGSSVAIIGLGGVGMSAIQGARISGAAQVIGIDPIKAKRDLALRLGATDVVDPAEGDPVAQVRDLTRGQGVDYGFEIVGKPELVHQAYDMTRRNGTTVIVGMARATDTISFPLLSFMNSGKHIVNAAMGGTDPQRDYPAIIRMAETGRLDLASMVSRKITLDDVDPTLRAMDTCEDIRAVVY